MATYRVYLQTVASTTIEVEADDPDDAYEKAFDKRMPHICAQCSGWRGGPNLELGDMWEIPEGMSVDEAVEEIG